MDPSKSAGAPPAGWSDEKSSMGHAPPPPYQDQPYPGYPQPGPGYPQPGPGYPQPGPGYPQPGPGQPQPGQGHPQPGQGYPPHPQGYGSPPQYGGAVGQQPYPMGQQATVTVQPTVYVTQVPLAYPINDYLCYSIFTMLCCCLPLGIAALIYSISTREANHVGNRQGAERSSRIARILNHVGLGIGIGLVVLYIVYAMVLANTF
ncbi:hypothetical protein PBY51_018040 [Eleginops maclovinus]|uniref:Proline-rich transmembrane protein 1-like n=1 Tax=Eleginops maclovinus TaxID=56733 RepID=A0AAN7XID0_ELEMC|nr:hypothetical protein PBY51_018040 [Eleginops maclovinus]